MLPAGVRMIFMMRASIRPVSIANNEQSRSAGRRSWVLVNPATPMRVRSVACDRCVTFTTPGNSQSLSCPFNLCKAIAERARKEFGIRGRTGVWRPEDDALLGTTPDVEVAKQINRSRMAVQVRRGVLGIPKPDPKYRPWSAEKEAQLGTASDSVIAARIGRQSATVAARRRKLHIPPAPIVRPDGWSSSKVWR